MSLIKIDQSFATQIWLHLFLLKWQKMIKNSSWHGNYLKLLRWLKILVDVEILTDF